MSRPAGPPLSQNNVCRAVKQSMRQRVNAAGTETARAIDQGSTKCPMSGCTAISKRVMTATCQSPISRSMRCNCGSIDSAVQGGPGLPTGILLEGAAFLKQRSIMAVGVPRQQRFHGAKPGLNRSCRATKVDTVSMRRRDSEQGELAQYFTDPR